MNTRENTKITKKITVINTNVDYNDDCWYADFIDYCEANGFKIVGKGSDMKGLYMGGKVTFIDWVERNISDETQEFWEDLRRVKNGSYIDYYVVTGSLGLWYGTRGGICETFDNLYDALCKCATDAYDIEAYCDGEKIEWKTMHHDGTNTFEIRRLSYEDYDKVRYWEDEDGDVFEYIRNHAQPITYEMLGK